MESVFQAILAIFFKKLSLPSKKAVYISILERLNLKA